MGLVACCFSCLLCELLLFVGGLTVGFVVLLVLIDVLLILGDVWDC